jgi:hypothetical protein
VHPAPAGIYELNAAANVADDTWEEIAVADNEGKELAVADDTLVPRTGTGLAVYDQVVVMISGEAGRIGTHAAEDVPSLAPFLRDRWVVPGRERVSGNLTTSRSSLRRQLE